MAVTKAQLVVWGLIAGLSVWGSAMLSRVKLPESAAAPAPLAMLAVAEPRIVGPVVEASPVAVATALPAVVPVFPFPDNLVAESEAKGRPAEPLAAAPGLDEIPGDAIPQIAAIESDGPPDEVSVAAQAAVVVAEEPPIPMPSRPIVAQPVRAVPLSEVKTLYVAADALNVRAAPSTTGPVLQKLPLGFAVAAREQSNEWIGFLLRDGSTGWMRTDYLSETMPAVQPAVAAVPAGGPLNLMM